MRATNWEFTNRAIVFGLVLGLGFPLYSVDPQNAAAAVANWLAAQIHGDPDRIARCLFGFAALLVILAALIRTWASAYLQAAIVYASDVKSESLVADGPYRYVRNPLYFANISLAVGMGAMMSRLGFLLAVIAMVIFCYRLILREEAALQASQGGRYADYRKAVPRLCPALWPRISSAGRPAQWADGFKAEFWYWGFAAGLVVFAITLKTKLFFFIVAASIFVFWASSLLLQKKSPSQA